MKLYTEEQVRWAFRNGHIYAHLNEVDENKFMGELVPIKLPSDEEIEDKSWEFNPLKKLDGEFLRGAFRSGAKWIINKIEGGEK